MSANHFIHRLHLYLALALLPWFLVYGVSSLAIAHPALFVAGDKVVNPKWEPVGERPFDLDIPEDPDWRQVGAQILRQVDDEGLFYIGTRDPAKPVVTRFSFWSLARYTYDTEHGVLAIAHQPMTLRSFFLRLHIRGGFVQESFFSDLWAVIVDVVNIGFLLWVATGLYMWWLLPSTRRWGGVTLGGGLLCFVWFMVAL